MQIQAEIDWYVSQLEKKFSYSFKEGYNEGLRYMAHLQEPLRVLHHPLAVHVGSEGVTLATHGALLAMGFSSFRCQVLLAYNTVVRSCESWRSIASRSPAVHGHPVSCSNAQHPCLDHAGADGLARLQLRITVHPVGNTQARG